MRFTLVAAAAVLFLAGCASNNYCLGEQPYQKAQTYPPLQSTAELKLPESPSALRIPPQPAKAVPYGYKDENGEGVCLDKPPQLPRAAPATTAG